MEATRGKQKKLENSHRYFANKECQYYPCHVGVESMNCLFCFCPLYSMEPCPGTVKYVENNGKQVKDCSRCDFPHQPENYDKIIEILSSR